MNNLTEIPGGFKTYLPSECEELKYIFDRVFSVFEVWGYKRVIPPTVEYLKTFKATDEIFERISFKLVDKDTGNLLAVRPDFTPQIARIVATSYKGEEPPFRFYYGGSVLRDVEKLLGMKCIANIPKNSLLEQSYNKKEILYVKKTDANFNKLIDTIVEELETLPEYEKTSVPGLLKRIRDSLIL